MNKKDLVEKITSVLAENNFRKPVTAQKTVLHISDDEGHKSDFVVKKTNRGLLLTNKDVSAVIEAFIAVVEDSIRRGEEITLHGFGNFGLKYRAARETKHPTTGEAVHIAAHYVPTFDFGNRLRIAAKLFEAPSNDRGDT